MIKEAYSGPPQITTREPRLEDMEDLRAILQKSLIDSESGNPITSEIEEVLSKIGQSLESNTAPIRYRVAEHPDGQLLGVMGMMYPDGDMVQYARSPNSCVELVNAFVDPEVRKSGAGRLLVDDLLRDAKVNGATEVVVNSGPRYRETGWPFWARVMSGKLDVSTEGYGETALLKDKYGPGLDAMVWRANIS